MIDTYYNDNETGAWLEYLIRTRLIPKGRIDIRPIHEVKPIDVSSFKQAHFFAGIGGWNHALKLAGWPATAPVWTGSCPCQPFSVAGKGKGYEDDRNLWPEFHRLIKQCRPATVFGEQVSGKAGRLWLDRVRFDLETLGYAFGAADLPAAGVGAPHIRQRLFWVGHSGSIRQFSYKSVGGNSQCIFPGSGETISKSTDATAIRQAWNNYESVFCSDGEKRRIESGTFPLADEFPGRVELLRGYGNAIVPQIAAEFIMAYMDII